MVEIERSYLPCAGITLVRFYGYHLSPLYRRLAVLEHPEESENVSLAKEAAKIT